MATSFGVGGLAKAMVTFAMRLDDIAVDANGGAKACGFRRNASAQTLEISSSNTAEDNFPDQGFQAKFVVSGLVDDRFDCDRIGGRQFSGQCEA